MIRFPDIPRLGLGVGLDLPWGAPVGFHSDERGVDRVAPAVKTFLNAHEFSHLFVSWQPKNRNRLDPSDYFEGFDDLFATTSFAVRALHHTALNLGALERYERGAILDFTNALIARYGFAWVNEDLGVWSLHGRPLPYPLPPYLTDRGLDAAISATAEVQEALSVPLVVEFPGFSEGTSLIVGKWHAYDFFRELAVQTGSPVTLDVGHLLSYQWLRGGPIYGELERLPLDHCFEIHLSGCAIDGDRFLDLHHGVLLDEQVELLRRLLPLCPNLKAVTYEDPRFDDGALIAEARENYAAVRGLLEDWA